MENSRKILGIVLIVSGVLVGINIGALIMKIIMPNPIQCTPEVVVYDTTLNKIEVIQVTGTKYNAVAEQTDATPYNTADGSFIDTLKLRNGEIRWVALSQDLLWFKGGPFHWGDSLFAFDFNPAITGWWQVHDAMNSRYTKRIDFLQPVGVDDISGQNRSILISKSKFYD